MKTYQQFINEASSHNAINKVVKNENDVPILQNLYNASCHLSFESFTIFVNDNYRVLNKSMRAGQVRKGTI